MNFVVTIEFVLFNTTKDNRAGQGGKTTTKKLSIEQREPKTEQLRKIHRKSSFQPDVLVFSRFDMTAARI